MMKMSRQTGAFPPVNNLLQKKWNARAYKQHLEKRKAMTTGLNTKQPKEYLHMQLNLKKIQLEEERQEAIDHENRILLAKLTNVIRSAGQLDNWNEEYDDLPKSLNRPQMLREQERIAAENDKISKRLTSVTAEYNTDQLEDDYLLHEYYLTLKAQETKGFEVDTRGFEDDEPHYYNRDHEVATSNGSVHPSDGGQTETDNQADKLSTSPSSTSKTSKTTSSKKGGGAFRRPKPQPRLPLLGQSRRKEEEKRKREAASKPAPYDDKKDAARLFKAVKGMAKAELALIHTLARRTYSQRQQTKNVFEKQYELDLEDELIEILGDEWTDLISVLLAKREIIDATALHQALKGELPMTDTVIGLLCTRNNSAISTIKKTYSTQYGTQLADDIKNETKGQLRHLFLTLAKGIRMEGTEVNAEKAKQDAEVLRSEPEGERWKAETGKLAELLRVASFSQISEVLEQYEQLYGTRVMDEFQQHLAGDFRDAMQAMVKCLYHCAMYMAERHRISLVKRNSPSLIRLLVTRSEIDMPLIRKAYRQRYGETLMDAIESICMEPYKRALINMVLVHGSATNQQDQQEAESRGAFSATKVPSLPKVASPANKAKPLRRPSPNKAAKLNPSNPLMKSVKVKVAQQQQQPQQPARESILVSRRPGGAPKKSVTVLDPRAKQTPPSATRWSPSKVKRPAFASKPSPNSPDKASRKASVDKKEKRTPESSKTAEAAGTATAAAFASKPSPNSPDKSSRKASVDKKEKRTPESSKTAEAAGTATAAAAQEGSAQVHGTQETLDSPQDALPSQGGEGREGSASLEGAAEDTDKAASASEREASTRPGVASGKGSASRENPAGSTEGEAAVGLSQTDGGQEATAGKEGEDDGPTEDKKDDGPTEDKKDAEVDGTQQVDDAAKVRVENPASTAASNEERHGAGPEAAASKDSAKGQEADSQP